MNQIKTSEIYNAVDNDNYRIIRDEVPYSIGDVSNIILDANQVRDLLRDNRNSEFDTNNSTGVAEHLRDSWKLTTKNTSQKIIHVLCDCVRTMQIQILFVTCS